MPLDICPSQLRTRKFNSKAGRKHYYFLKKRDCTTRELTTTCCRSSYYIFLSLYQFGKEQNEVQSQLLSEFLLVYCSNKIKSILLRTQNCILYALLMWGKYQDIFFQSKKTREIQGQRECIHPHHQENKVQRTANTNNVLVALVSASGESWKNASLQVSLHFFSQLSLIMLDPFSVPFVCTSYNVFSFSLRKLNITSRNLMLDAFYYHLTRIYIIFSILSSRNTSHTSLLRLLFLSFASCS